MCFPGARIRDASDRIDAGKAGELKPSDGLALGNDVGRVGCEHLRSF